jgi:hypothetical protein
MKYSSKVPQTKEEVIEHFNEYPDKFMAECMIGLFEVRMLQGDTVMQAYETTLRVAVERPTPLAPDTATPSEAGESS